MLTFKNKSFFSFENLRVNKKIHYLLKTLYMKKNDNQKKYQVIQHLNGISEVNHVHMIYHFLIIFMGITQELV